MKTSVIAVVLFTVAVSPAAAQPQTITCPPTVTMQMKRIAPFPYDPGKGSIAGFQQIFVPTAVRLTGGAPGEGPADNDDAKPGTPFRFTLWNGKPPMPTETFFATCHYEGGLNLRMPLRKGVRTCSLVRTEAPSTAANPSHAGTMSRVVMTCQ